MTMPLPLGPWCLRCGGPAIVTDESLDPRHPIGRCRPSRRDVRGCGRQALTRLPAEADAAYDKLRRSYATRAHAGHHPETDPNPLCSHCAAAGRRIGLPLPGTDAVGIPPAAAASKGGQ